MQSIGQKLIAYWEANELPIQRGATEQSVKFFEDKYHFKLPEEMRGYLLCVDGMSEYFPGYQDKEGYSFWSLSRIRTVAEEAERISPGARAWLSFPNADSYFIFADYFDWSWAIAIRLSDIRVAPAPVFLIGKQAYPVQIAASFSEFVELYLIDSPHLYGRDT